MDIWLGAGILLVLGCAVAFGHFLAPDNLSGKAAAIATWTAFMLAVFGCAVFVTPDWAPDFMLSIVAFPVGLLCLGAAGAVGGRSAKTLAALAALLAVETTLLTLAWGAASATVFWSTLAQQAPPGITLVHPTWAQAAWEAMTTNSVELFVWGLAALLVGALASAAVRRARAQPRGPGASPA